MRKRNKKEATVTRKRMAGEDHAVLTVEGGSGASMRKACPECPWRKANAGSFPPEAFRHSAPTSYDMGASTFGCHMAGKDNPATCAGFLSSLSCDDNMLVRMARMRGEKLGLPPDPELFDTYRKMAEANGVPADDPALEQCMPEARYSKKRRPLAGLLDDEKWGEILKISNHLIDGGDTIDGNGHDHRPQCPGSEDNSPQQEAGDVQEQGR